MTWLSARRYRRGTAFARPPESPVITGAWAGHREFEPNIPRIVVLVDQSGSMTANFMGVTRWQAVYDALFGNNMNGIIYGLEDQVEFGLSLYTSDDGFMNGLECPLMEEVPPQLANAGAMDALYAGNSPIEDTPTGEAIDVVVPQLLALPGDEPRVIVVATDGEPDTCAVPDPQNGQAVSVQSAADAYAAGVEVYMISVGNQVSQQHLQDMADAGVGMQGAPFWQANDTQGLIDAFNTIINGVRDCKLTLNAEVVENMEDGCTVVLNGNELDLNDPDGWQLNNASEIELLGNACTEIQDGGVDEVNIACECEAIIG